MDPPQMSSHMTISLHEMIDNDHTNNYVQEMNSKSISEKRSV